MAKKKSGFIAMLKEMVGRTEPDAIQLTAEWQKLFLTDVPTDDLSKPIYGLNMAIYKASVVTDLTDGKKYGEDYLYGASFGKPIVNAVASFAFTGMNAPKIVGDSDFHDDVNNFLSKNRKQLFDSMRNGCRDGDSYVRLMADDRGVYLEEVDPSIVEILTAEDNINEVIGYDLTHIIKKEKGKTDKIVIIEQYRAITPYYRRVKMVNGAETEVQSEDNGFKFLSMCHYANDRDANALYGTSDYQNVYLNMKSYHKIMETMLKGTVYNSQPAPMVSGIKNFAKFLANNFGLTGKTEDGEPKYNIKWNPNKLMLLGEGAKLEMLTIPDHVTPAAKVLEMLFYCICQASETPEFVMGTAVSSSKASVSEQAAIIINKAYRKRADFEDFIYDIIDMFIQYKLATGAKLSDVPEDIVIEWPPIVTEDKQLTLELIKSLREMGIITDKTALLLSGVKITDVDQEVTEARQEGIDRAIQEARQADIYSPFSANQQENQDIQEMTKGDNYRSQRKIKSSKK